MIQIIIRYFFVEKVNWIKHCKIKLMVVSEKQNEIFFILINISDISLIIDFILFISFIISKLLLLHYLVCKLNVELFFVLVMIFC